jgi:hypothetical protein
VPDDEARLTLENDRYFFSLETRVSYGRSKDPSSTLHHSMLTFDK